MRSEISGNKPNAAATMTGDITVNTAPYTSGSIKTATKTKTTTPINIPAGAYSIEIFNNSIENTITVDGIALGPQLKASYTYKINEVARKQDLLPAFTVVNALNDEVVVRMEYPSDNAFNPSTL